MAHSLEARSPFLDPELMQFAASIPAPMKLRGMEKKVILRDALRAWLPGPILDRPKQGFSVPIAEWLRTDLRDYSRDLLLDPAAPLPPALPSRKPSSPARPSTRPAANTRTGSGR